MPPIRRAAAPLYGTNAGHPTSHILNDYVCVAMDVSAECCRTRGFYPQPHLGNPQPHHGNPQPPRQDKTGGRGTSTGTSADTDATTGAGDDAGSDDHGHGHGRGAGDGPGAAHGEALLAWHTMLLQLLDQHGFAAAEL